MITVNIEKAREIAHKMRRAARESEFAPHDNVIAKQMPDSFQKEAEEARQKIRAKYESVQTSIEKAKDIHCLTKIIKQL